MKFDVLPVDALTAEQRALWVQFCGGDGRRVSPYYHPAFAEMVHAAGRPVQVALLTGDDGLLRGVYPHHREGRSVVYVGFPMCDYEGVIGPAHDEVDPRALLRALDARHMPLRHWYPSEGANWAPYVHRRLMSPQMDVRGGMDGYRERATKAINSELGDTRRKTRKLEKEFGSVTFKMRNVDRAWFEQLKEWKRDQYQRTGASDVFREDWRDNVLAKLVERDDDEMRGLMSTLAVADQPIAVHLGMQVGSVLHYWFPAYDREFHRYSPGRVLLSMMIEHAPECGVEVVDFGKGEVDYKLRLMSMSADVAEGEVYLSAWRSWLARWRGQTVDSIRGSALYDGLRRLKRRLKHQPGRK